MKTLNHIFWIFLFAVAFSACSKDSEPCDPDDEESPCYAGVSGGGKLLVVEAKLNGNTYVKYDYDNQNRATAIHYLDTDGSVVLTTNYIYAGGNTPKTVRSRTNTEVVSVEEYTIGGDGRPTSMVSTIPSPNGDMMSDYQFSYSKNTMVETVTSRDENSPGVYINTYTYDAKGNLLSIVYTFNGQWESTMEHGNYDDKIAVNFHGNPNAWRFGGSNNLGTVKSTVANEGVVTDEIWKYTYNNASYPTKAEVFDKGSDEPKEIHTFIYKPAK